MSVITIVVFRRLSFHIVCPRPCFVTVVWRERRQKREKREEERKGRRADEKRERQRQGEAGERSLTIFRERRQAETTAPLPPPPVSSLLPPAPAPLDTTHSLTIIDHATFSLPPDR